LFWYILFALVLLFFSENLDLNEILLLSAAVVGSIRLLAYYKHEIAMEIAKQVTTKKNFPWPGASNIKMPIIARACIDYASRTLPEVIQNDRVVKSSNVY